MPGSPGTTASSWNTACKYRGDREPCIIGKLASVCKYKDDREPRYYRVTDKLPAKIEVAVSPASLGNWQTACKYKDEKEPRHHQV
jgi:hypothetical protein